MLAQRVASAVVGVPVLLALVLIGGWVYVLAAAVILAVGGAEFAHLRYERWLHPRSLQLALSVAAITIAAHWGLIPMLAVMGAAIGALLATSMENRTAAGWLDAGILYVGGLGSTIVLLRELDNGRDWVLVALLGTFAVDTAAYFTGRAIGRHRMSPRISPKKTWEGFVGGWAGGFLAVIMLNYVLGLRIEPQAVVWLAALLPLVAALGDLAESAVKRRTHVKDAGGLIPGHGGFLDRLDSLLFTFTLTYIVARAVG